MIISSQALKDLRLGTNLMAKILYISYDGMVSHIGQAQVLPYLRGLVLRGHRFSLISFERNLKLPEISALKQELHTIGIDWHPRQFRVRPPLISKLIDQAVLQYAVGLLMAKNHYDIVHSRSYVAASAGLRAARRHSVPHLFDMRGFWVDQRLEGSRWPQKKPFFRWLYNKWKRKERELISGSNSVIVLTEAARRILVDWEGGKTKPIAVIPCAYLHQPHNEPDCERRANARAKLGVRHDESVLVYLGSLGSVYMLQEMLTFYAQFQARFGRTRFFFLGSTDREFVLATAARIGLKFSEDELIFLRCAPNEVHLWLNAGDAAVCFITPTFSSLGVSPTKLAEYLAIGLPTVVNSQVGDVASIIADMPGSGVVIDDFEPGTLNKAMEQLAALVPADRTAIRGASQAIHDLPQAIDAFDRVYIQLTERDTDD